MSGEKKVIRVSAVLLRKPPPRVLRVAAYCRVSALSDEQSVSIEAQIDYYQNMICNHGGWEFVGIYSVRRTGRNARKRKGFQRLLDDYRTGKIDLILTKSISRLGRDTVFLLQTAQELKNMHVDMFFEIENLYLHNPKAMLMITI